MAGHPEESPKELFASAYMISHLMRHEFDERFYQELEHLVKKKIISKQRDVPIKEKYKALRKKINLKNCLEVVDPSPDNFRLYNGRVYLVDIHAIKQDLKGRGLAKTFLKWIKTKKQRENFESGYNSVSSMKFLTRDYLEFVYLYHLVKNIALKYHGRRDFSKQIKQLNKLLKGELK